MIGHRPLLLLALLLLATGGARAQSEDAARLFARMHRAEQTLGFVGEVREEIAFATDRPRPADGFANPPRFGARLVEENFAMAVVGRDRIAGREAVGLELRPRNGVSPAWTFWIDEETGLRLAYEQRSADGERVAAGRYLSVERAERRARRDPGTAADAAVRRAAARLVDLEALPDGFVPVALERTGLGPNQSVAAVRLTLWDGLSGVVLLVYPRQREVADRPFLASRSFGALTASALGPLPHDALESWLERFAQGPAARLGPRQLRRLAERETDRQEERSDRRQDRPADR